MDDVTVEALGNLGDGVARVDGNIIVVPGGLPGEMFRISNRSSNRGSSSFPTGDVERLTDSEARQTPPCPHFGPCGGCSLQHVRDALYLDFKTQLVKRALQKAQMGKEVLDLVSACRPCPPASRRRISFAAKLLDGQAALGFLGRASHTFVPIETCVIALPMLNAALPELRRLAAQVLRGSETLSLLTTVCENGLDVAISTDRDPTPDMLAALVRTAARGTLLRVSVNGDVVFEQERPLIRFGEAQVSPPSGGFLQAVGAVEDEMAEMVTVHLRKSKTVADLFSGSGAFALRLSASARVIGYESDAGAVEALKRAVQPAGHKSIRAEQRDLFDTPLTARELREFDGVCLDPPRAGAEAQCNALAKSDVQRIAYVSCNPQSLARDLSVLLKGGYKASAIQPFDQFLYAPHVEVVTLLEKQGPTKRKRIF